jgi:fructokinase
MPAEVVPAEDPAWDLTTRYVAQALSNLVCILSPRRIILGGGVTRGGKLGTERFFGMIRSGLQSTLNHYIRSPAIETDIAQFIVPPRLGDNAGICGAIAAAQAALAGATPHAGVVRP